MKKGEADSLQMLQEKDKSAKQWFDEKGEADCLRKEKDKGSLPREEQPKCEPAN